MTIREYQQLSKRTCASLGSVTKDLFHMNMGIATELGEMIDPIKKNIAYGKAIDYVNVSEEAADALWYVVNKAAFEQEELEEPMLIERDLEDTVDSLLAWKGFSNQSLLNDIYSFVELMGLDFEKALINNIDKLAKRYPDKFSEFHAINRDLEAERKELEK